MKSTRQQILEILQNQESSTAVELSRALLVSPANVRYHLAMLRREDLVEDGEFENRGPGSKEDGKKRSAGRPSRRYRLSARANPDRFDRLAEALLVEAMDQAPTEERSALLTRIAARMAGRVKPDGSLAKRLVQSVLRLNELHYEASWEARPGDPQVKFGRCPYSTILPHHPELCQLDAELLESLIGAPVEQTARQILDAHGVRYCQFVVGSSNNDVAHNHR